MIRLHDTASGEVRELAQREPGVVSMYVCGPTVYDAPHLGHGRAVLTYDVLRRYLEWTGVEVRHVSNITDVDDKIIERAAQRGTSEPELAAEYENVYWDAMDRLGALRPTETPHATEYIADMVTLVEDLVGRGLAYDTGDGVYLEVEKVDGYGLLAPPLDQLRSAERTEANDEKRSPLDFALWKKAKPGEPSWPSPWGDGRPGWHTECVVMSLDLLGEGFDLHTGGMDLMFPHHENERAQAVALGRDFARHWTHHAFITAGGEKMSKSLGNFTTLVDLLDKVRDARAYRLLVLQAHYRAPLEVTPATIDDAVSSLAGLDNFARRTAGLDGAPDEELVAEFRTAMDDDLRTPAAMSVVFRAVRDGNSALDAGDTARGGVLAATVRELSRAVGLELEEQLDDLDPDTAALVAERDAARREKRWTDADAARDQLVAAGWIVEDSASGTTVRRA
jgi:cysteinyl-tRNA synthetase